MAYTASGSLCLAVSVFKRHPLACAFDFHTGRRHPLRNEDPNRFRKNVSQPESARVLTV